MCEEKMERKKVWPLLLKVARTTLGSGWNQYQSNRMDLIGLILDISRLGNTSTSTEMIRVDRLIRIT